MSPEQPPIVARLRARARHLKTDTLALYLAARHPATPWHAKVLAAVVVAYALSPIDLIPDFVPVLGYLDDLILVPAGIALVLRLIPPQVLAECREQAAALARKPPSWAAATVIVLLWLGLAALLGLWLWRLFS